VELKPSVTVNMNSVKKDNDLLLSLKIDNLRLTDAGPVKVQARNTEGVVSSTAKLTVKGKLSFTLLDTEFLYSCGIVCIECVRLLPYNWDTVCIFHLLRLVTSIS